MELTPAQTAIISDTHRYRVLVCGRKFGKTTTASEELSACAFAANDRRVIYIAPTLDDARRLMWDRLKNRFGAVVEKSNDTRLELVIPTQDGGKSIIFLGSWEKIENYRGDEFDLEIYDEVQDYRNFWNGWQNAMRPTLSPRKGSALFMGTPKGFTHLYDLYNLQDTDPAWKSFHFTSYDNPHLDLGEIEEAKRTLPEDSFAQEYMADFRKMEGLVYKEFSRERHVFTEEEYDGEHPVIVKVFGGVDFGFTNPAAVYTIKKDTDSRYWITDEFYETQRTDAQIADYVAALKWNEAYPDPESASGIEELKRRGVNVRDVLKNKDSIRNGINTVRELFKANRLFISASCRNLIWELETYAYPERKPDHNEEEKPIKENDHACDAIRYALSMELIAKASTIRIHRPERAGFSHRR